MFVEFMIDRERPGNQQKHNSVIDISDKELVNRLQGFKNSVGQRTVSGEKWVLSAGQVLGWPFIFSDHYLIKKMYGSGLRVDVFANVLVGIGIRQLLGEKEDWKQSSLRDRKQTVYCQNIIENTVKH